MLPREDLPQIPRKNLVRFCKFCKNEGVPIEVRGIAPRKLVPIQKHLNKKKLKDMMKTPLETPLLISKEGYIVDGHHRWASELLKDQWKPVPCIKFGCSVSDLVRLGHDFDGSFTKNIDESHK